MKEIIAYTTITNKSPYRDWYRNLDKSTRVRISKRLERIQEGNYGDFKKLDDEISEFRFAFGSGYRVYFAEANNIIIILLCAGDKNTQSNDIKRAKEYLKDCKERGIINEN